MGQGCGQIFAAYLMFNGFERFWIEKIRVNTTFDLAGITMTQAELISVCTFLWQGLPFGPGRPSATDAQRQELGENVRQTPLMQ